MERVTEAKTWSVRQTGELRQLLLSDEKFSGQRGQIQIMRSGKIMRGGCNCRDGPDVIALQECHKHIAAICLKTGENSPVPRGNTTCKQG